MMYYLDIFEILKISGKILIFRYLAKNSISGAKSWPDTEN